MGFLNGDTFLE
jgi:hypothetical protein